MALVHADKDVDDDASDKKSEYEDCLATSESTNNSDAVCVYSLSSLC